MLINLSQKYPLQNYINLSRIKNIDSINLGNIHKEFGKFLGLEILSNQEKIIKNDMLNYDKLQNLEYFDDSNFVIIGILRAGLYIALGIREIFKDAEFILTHNALKLDSIKNKKIILADSVINTGESIMQFLESINTNCQIYIATNVIYKPTYEILKTKFNDIKIFCIRESLHSYKGKGKSDTGNRLFNV